MMKLNFQSVCSCFELELELGSSFFPWPRLLFLFTPRSASLSLVFSTPPINPLNRLSTTIRPTTNSIQNFRSEKPSSGLSLPEAIFFFFLCIALYNEYHLKAMLRMRSSCAGLHIIDREQENAALRSL